MATTTVSIGSNQSIDTAVPASSSADGSDWVITWNKTLSASVSVGDLATATDHDDGAFVYLIIAISGSNYTLKYISGTGGNQSPYALCTDSYCSAPPTFTFKRAFSTITAFEEMVDNTSNLYWGASDDVIGECHADGTFTSDSRVYFTTKQSLSSVTLTAYDGERHGGTTGAGDEQVVVKPSSGSGHNNAIIDVNIDDFTIEFIDIDLNDLNTENTNKSILLRGTNNNNIIRNNLIHDKDGNPGNTGPFMIHVVGAGSSSDTLTIQNNIIYNIVETGGDNAQGINTNQWSGTVNIYNNTIYNIDAQGTSKQAWGIVYGNVASAVINIKNNIVAKMVADGAASNERAYQKFNGSSTENASNNLSDDTTTTAAYKAPGTDSLQDKTLSEIAFVSVSAGAEDLHIKRASVCNRAGASLGGTNKVNIDIDGETIFNNWAIGADFIADGPTFLFSMLT
tara:strand:+ start:8603 stop:9961 length:1359 start_codon:yes stop_codon:yes gene_type:complete